MAGVKVYYERYASPGDVEYHELNVPASLAAWTAAAKKAGEEAGDGPPFIEGTMKPAYPGGVEGKLLINTTTVQHVIAL